MFGTYFTDAMRSKVGDTIRSKICAHLEIKTHTHKRTHTHTHALTHASNRYQKYEDDIARDSVGAKGLLLFKIQSAKKIFIC